MYDSRVVNYDRNILTRLPMIGTSIEIKSFAITGDRTLMFSLTRLLLLPTPRSPMHKLENGQFQSTGVLMQEAKYSFRKCKIYFGDWNA